MHTLLSSIPLPVLLAGGTSLVVALLLVCTQAFHGPLSMDSATGIQKVHTDPTTRVGGIAIVAGVLVAALAAGQLQQSVLWPLLLASIPAFAFGLTEDLTKRVSVQARLLATMACGVLGWAITGLSITGVNVPVLDWFLGFTIVSIAFTAFAVGGIANAINIIDGFNGLAAGTTVIILSSFALLASRYGDAELVFACLVLTAAVLGFAVINWPFGKIFLGDGGAYFVGFAVAWLAVLILARHSQVSAWAPMMVCAYPVLEVAYSILRRRRREVSPGKPDRLHLHSLIERRLVRHWLPNASPLVRNSATGAVMWLAALLPALIAVQSPTHTYALASGFIGCGFLYSALYARLTQFRWCFSAATLRVKAA